MQATFSAYIKGWSVAPTVSLEVQGQASPLAPLSHEGLVLDFVPISLRRRCSTLSRVTLAVAHAAVRRAGLTAHHQTVFASSHGESHITKDLLVELARDQQLSPMGFSLSVHNAASGLYSIATGNTAPSTAIAAGSDTFRMGLLEALLSLEIGEAEDVLLVCSDDLVPSEFHGGQLRQTEPYALAIALGRTPVADSPMLSVHPMPTGERPHHTLVTTPQAIQVARWLWSGDGRCTLSSGELVWQLVTARSRGRDLFACAQR
jgi:hypothetical protein